MDLEIMRLMGVQQDKESHCFRIRTHIDTRNQSSQSTRKEETEEALGVIEVIGDKNEEAEVVEEVEAKGITRMMLTTFGTTEKEQNQRPRSYLTTTSSKINMAIETTNMNQITTRMSKKLHQDSNKHVGQKLNGVVMEI